MKKLLMPYVARGLASQTLLKGKRHFQELKRRSLRQPHRLQVFIKVDDPYSFLLVQVMDEMLRRFDVQVQYHTVLNLAEDMYPAMDMWRHYAVEDARLLARLYNLSFEAPAPIANTDRIRHGTALLLAAETGPDYLQVARQVMGELWTAPASDSDTSSELMTDTLQSRLAANERYLKHLGHYMSASIYYGGEWYWGIDRLDHLERRLIELGTTHDPDEQVRFDRTYRAFCTRKAPAQIRHSEPLVLYWSARSPYSYIGLERAVELARFHDIPLEIKPVLPMMMRDMYVPPTKKMYIFHDTKREAAKLGLPYGMVADPLGPAVERCYALYDYACGADKGAAFLLSFARGVNAEGIRAETDSGLKRIVERAGLDWSHARALLTDRSWTQWTQENLDEMFAMGCWGVPSLRYGELGVWGQDRIGLIEQAIMSSGELEQTSAAEPG